MDAKRLAVAAVVAWVVDSIYAFLVFGMALQNQIGRYPAVFRSPEAMSATMPLMFASSLIAMFIVAYIFAKGHDGGSGLREGLRFGFVFGAFSLFGIAIPNYAVYNYGRRLAAETAVAAFIEMVLMGAVLGLVYKPSMRAARRAAAV